MPFVVRIVGPDLSASPTYTPHSVHLSRAVQCRLFRQQVLLNFELGFQDEHALQDGRPVHRRFHSQPGKLVPPHRSFGTQLSFQLTHFQLWREGCEESKIKRILYYMTTTDGPYLHVNISSAEARALLVEELLS